MKKHQIKNENNIKQLESGVLKDNHGKKIRYDLIPHELLTRLAELYTQSTEKYPENNWKKATKEESKIYKEAAWRHFIKWTNGLDPGEDHGIQTIWNIIAWVWINEYKD